MLGPSPAAKARGDHTRGVGVYRHGAREHIYIYVCVPMLSTPPRSGGGAAPRSFGLLHLSSHRGIQV